MPDLRRAMQTEAVRLVSVMGNLSGKGASNFIHCPRALPIICGMDTSSRFEPVAAPRNLLNHLWQHWCEIHILMLCLRLSPQHAVHCPCIIGFKFIRADEACTTLSDEMLSARLSDGVIMLSQANSVEKFPLELFTALSPAEPF
nr:hypothetical protein Iba_chr11eCG15570 [Ipomoea batatas]